MILALLARPALACGPDFPDRLLDDRGRTLLDLPEARFVTAAEHLVPPPAHAFVSAEDRVQEYQEADGLEWPQVERVRAMRQAPDEVAAFALGVGLPDDVRLYTAGAVAWRHDDASAAVATWREVLDLPDHRLRGTWAAYMLAEAGEEPFARVREEARAGGADAAGLAVASFGEEARIALDQGRVPDAIALYAQQARYGSGSGATSLLLVARQLAEDGRWRRFVGDPLTRDLLVLYA